MDRYIDMNSISTIDRMIYRRRKAKEEKKKDLGCKLFWGIYSFGITIDREIERGCAKGIKSKKFQTTEKQKQKKLKT